MHLDNYEVGGPVNEEDIYLSGVLYRNDKNLFEKPFSSSVIGIATLKVSQREGFSCKLSAVARKCMNICLDKLEIAICMLHDY